MSHPATQVLKLPGIKLPPSVFKPQMMNIFISIMQLTREICAIWNNIQRNK